MTEHIRIGQNDKNKNLFKIMGNGDKVVKL